MKLLSGMISDLLLTLHHWLDKETSRSDLTTLVGSQLTLIGSTEHNSWTMKAKLNGLYDGS